MTSILFLYDDVYFLKKSVMTCNFGGCHDDVRNVSREKRGEEKEEPEKL